MNSESQSSEEGKRNGKASLEDALQSDLFNALPASIAQLDGSGVIVTTNSAWKKVATRTPLLHGQNKVGTNYLEDCLKISSREANMAYRAVEGIREVIDGKRPSFWMEYPSGILQTAPRLIWLTVSTLPDGKKGAVIIHNDVTERKEEALAQHESEERFRLIVESVVDYAIVLLNPTGHVISWNIGASRMKGYQANEIMGRHFSIFFLPEDVEDGKPEKGLDTAMSDGRFEDEGWRVRKDGSCFWANVIVTTVRDKSGNLRGFSKVTRDLTAYKDMVDELHA
ncbi:MAG: PAS domain S-box protein, partial [Chthoniobacterales bacterium]